MESPLKIKQDVQSSIFKGPKNSDFFNNAPKENGLNFFFNLGIQIVVAQKKIKSMSPILNNSDVVEEYQNQSESKWMKNQDYLLKSDINNIPINSRDRTVSQVNLSLIKELNNVFEEKQNNNADYNSVEIDRKEEIFTLKKERKKEFLQSSPKFSQLNGEDPNKMVDKKEFALSEQRNSMENLSNNQRSSNNITNYFPNNKINENSEILKQMKDISEVIKLNDLETNYSN